MIRQLTIALAAVLAGSAIHAQDAQIHGQQDAAPAAEEEEAWPMETTGDISILVVREHYRIHAEHCSREVPALKAAFGEEMKSLKDRVRIIGKRLLDSGRFMDMKQQKVSSTLVGALSAKLDGIMQELESQDPARLCPETLRSYRGITDQLLEDFLGRTLAGIRSTTQVLKSRNAP